MSRSHPAQPLSQWRPALLAVVIAVTAIATAGIIGSRFLWNLSPSLPRGLYRRDTGDALVRGAIVAFDPPSFAARVISQRGYLPPGAQLLKIIVALPGDRVCINGSFSVEGRLIGAVLDHDSAGRPLSPYHFCGTVPPGSAFVATPSPRSFDSRYFGPLPLESLTPVVPAWTF